MTAQELINASGRLLGELRGDRSFGATESAQLLVALNQLLASWSEEGTMVAQVTRNTFSSTGATSYVLGPTAPLLITDRPVKILAVSVTAASGIKGDAEIVNVARWAAIRDASQTGSFAELFYCDYAVPNLTMYFWPAPASGGSIAIESLSPLTALASLATTVSLAPGYERALIYNFAAQMAPEFGREVPPTIAAAADQAKAVIVAANAQLRPEAPADPRTEATE